MAQPHIETRVYTLDPASPDSSVIAKAAEILRAGGLVAFPTETVYGLGAHAMDVAAVHRIFDAKGRPATNPIIVHVGSKEAARDVAAVWPERAELLANACWPGPLTMVLGKSAALPEIVTAGAQSVALRMPAHPVASALLKACGIPIAAPSANRSSQISPTTAEHVLRSLNGRVDLILDAGPSPLGIESTVVSLLGDRPTILRPGSIGRERIEALLGEAVDIIALNVPEHVSAPSPGMQARHYAPNARVEWVESGLKEWALRSRYQGKRAGVLMISEEHGSIEASSDELIVVKMPKNAEAYAARLYAELHRLDAAGVDIIFIERPTDQAEWQAVHDRLRRMMH
jgi:L-threonylcarbamoyladenylate synthase